MSRLSSVRKLALGLLATVIVVATVSWITQSTPAPQARTTTSTVEHQSAHSTPRAPSLSPSLAVDDSVHAALYDYAKRPATTVALDPQGVERGKAAMRAWVSRSVNLDTAHQRQSARFNRIAYTDPQARDVPMHLADRRSESGVFANSASTGVVSVVYRESTTGHVMSFDKLDKEKAAPTGPGLSERDATAQARAFMLDNELIGESATDVIARQEVRERHVSQQQDHSDDLDFLVQQDIVLRRTFEGKPVINSSATVGVLPDTTHEIVGLKVSNWIPISTKDGARNQIKPAYDDTAARELAGQLEGKLADVISQELGADGEGAIVRGVEESWFSSERDGLIPALVFAVELPATDDHQTVAVAMTPYHDSAQIWQQGRTPRSAPLEPDSAE